MMSFSKFKTLFNLCVVLVVSCSSSNSEVVKSAEQNNNNPNTVDKQDDEKRKQWNLVFEDNFEDNLEKWNIWEGGAFNNEIQLYQKDQLSIANNLLSIKAEKKDIQGATTPFDTTEKNFQYVSGRIETKEQFGPSIAEGEQEYRIISRIKMPAGNGMWAAFWSYSDPWPTNGEIDIIETRGNQPKSFQSNIFYGPTPNKPIIKNEDTETKHTLKSDITADFHDYELIWSQTKLIIKFDGKTIHTYKADSKNYVASLFNKKQQIVLNLAVGGEFFRGANPDSFVESSEMIVDWVKVYKR